MKYVFGYTNFIDGSARGVVPPTNVFYQMKSRDTFAPIGPYIVTADEIKNVGKMQIRLKNNGKVMQNFNTDDMAHKIPRCIEWVTSIHTLLPGDILATGTNHRGLNPFMDGDKIELECEGLGVLTIKVQDKLKRKWARITRLQHKESGAEGVHTKQIGGKYAPAPRRKEDRNADALLRARRVLDGRAHHPGGERREVSAAENGPRQGRAEDAGIPEDQSDGPRAGAQARQRRAAHREHRDPAVSRQAVRACGRPIRWRKRRRTR